MSMYITQKKLQRNEIQWYNCPVFVEILSSISLYDGKNISQISKICKKCHNYMWSLVKILEMKKLVTTEKIGRQKIVHVKPLGLEIAEHIRELNRLLVK